MDYNKNDLRVIKTHKALLVSFFELLRDTPFGSITVNTLCNEAQVSRATFYAHFNDKYDLLKYALRSILPSHIPEYDAKMERDAYDFFKTHRRVFKNLLNDADDETYDVFRDFVPALVGIPIPGDPADIYRFEIFSHILTGGILKYLNWLVRKPPAEAAETAFFFQLMRVLCDSYNTSPDDETTDALLHKP